MISPPEPPSSIGERRGHPLAPLQTNFSRPTAAQLQSQPQPRVQRPRPSDYSSTNGSEGPVPLQSPVRRQSSKTSLRSLFGRDKASRAGAAPEPLVEIEESHPTQVATASDPLSPALTSPRTMPSTPTLASPTTPRPRATLKTSRSKTNDSNPPQDQYGWKPPPLFQAYPQSYKHGCLSAPAMSADSILRLHGAAGKAEDGRALKQEETKKREQRERKHLRTLSGTINRVEWTNKIFVLATTGYILQYAGEGKHDRLPEKMLQLGPQSVAFASDAIPGKHWVVQVSHNPEADSGPATTESSKSRLGLFGFGRSNARRLARSFLLVFDNPDSMISWLMAIREEIENRGGPKLTTEKHSEEDDPVPQLRSKSSARQMVKKDPHRISSLFLQAQHLRSPDEEDDGQSVSGMTWQSRRSSYVSVNRRSIIESRSGSVSTGWTENTPLTTGSDAQASSFTSTNAPGSPPMANSVPVPEEPMPEIDPVYTRSPPTSSHGNRQSLYGSPKPQGVPLAFRAEPAPYGQSPPTVPETLVRSASPPAPNFSVPSFSKKFVPRQGSTTVAQYPSAGSGVLRRGESKTDMSGSSISSPPQSPTYSAASSRHTDSAESSTIAREGQPRRVLRPSNSEDGLSRAVRAGHGGPNFPRVPHGAYETSPPPSRPLSLVGRPGMGPQAISEPQIRTAPPPAEPTPRIRLPAVHTDTQNAQSMSRRKSMPGLVIGPPSAPPPNCPLPKIPSPIIAQGAPSWSATSPSADRFYQSPQIRDHMQDRRKSGISPGTPSGPNKLTRSAARQSRML
ncbi:hypothetical protein N7492_005466 [Penicillium capsulatum]|uniref:PH domain-containing protein n=1 Tax=Penicillium capsulatum TaxID=69766 RepID=A0A9W9IBZ2_9EURO|nr:hypothetical protein N7492_005466 [Penicillium capsulatum]